MRKNFVVLFVLTFMCITIASLFSGVPNDKKDGRELAPLNPEFVKYINTPKNKAVTADIDKKYPLSGSVPNPVDMSYMKGKGVAIKTSNFPSRYDRREEDLVTDVKDQTNYPTCWTFAAYASLESCLMPERYDFSEWHLATSHGFDYDIQGAGNSMMTSAYLVRWSGPLLESDVPYAGTYNHGDNYQLAKHVQNIIYLPDRKNALDNDTIKHFLMNVGPVDFAFNWVRTAYNKSHSTMYFPNNIGQNHRLCIVGWDDNYSAEYFTHRPPGNGAFLARNSWGTGWGAGGYCYISYYDQSFQALTSFSNAESTLNYGTIYQYDPLGQTRLLGESKSWGANVFTAVNDEPLTAVGFYATDVNMKYVVKVYKNVKVTGGNPTKGKLVSTKTGKFPYAGYYTVKLNQPIPLSQGQKFTVAVQFITQNTNKAVPIEFPIMGHSSAAVANQGESFINLVGYEWEDLSLEKENSNVCIKAYTQYSKLVLNATGERKKIRGWVVSKDYGSIDINLDSNVPELVQRFRILRGTSGGTMSVIHEFTPAQLQNGHYNFEDRYIDSLVRYTYKVEAVDNNDEVVGSSDIMAI